MAKIPTIFTPASKSGLKGDGDKALMDPRKYADGFSEYRQTHKRKGGYFRKVYYPNGRTSGSLHEPVA